MTKSGQARESHTALLEGSLAFDFHDASLIRDGRHKLVVDQNDRVVLDVTLDNKVCDACSIGKGRNVTADLVESESQVLGKGTTELSFAFITNDHNGTVTVNLPTGHKRFRVISDGLASGFGKCRVNTTTQPFVGGDDNEELVRCGLVAGCVLEDLWAGLRQRTERAEYMQGNEPELAIPYCLPAFMAR